MFAYIIRRILIMIPTLIAISMISFTIIQLPPGDFLTTYVSQLSASGETVDHAELESLKNVLGWMNPFTSNIYNGCGTLFMGILAIHSNGTSLFRN